MEGMAFLGEKSRDNNCTYIDICDAPANGCGIYSDNKMHMRYCASYCYMLVSSNGVYDT
jgi:hypothetical protein